jgi:hypothetical protein
MNNYGEAIKKQVSRRFLMTTIQKGFSTTLILFYFSLIGLGAQGVALAGTVSLPQTGQTTCYNYLGTIIPCAGTGQDGELQAGVAWPNPRFTVSGDCVTDNLTGLMWAKNANLTNEGKTWPDSLDYVASLNSGSGLCGYKGWRLPNVIELESLVHADQSNPATWLNTQGFTNVQSDYYWSSSTQSSNAFTVSMRFGNIYAKWKSYHLIYIWPVRSGQ